MGTFIYDLKKIKTRREKANIKVFKVRAAISVPRF